MACRELTGKLALVTGAARGVGLATARELIEAGARPVLADIDADAVAAAAASLPGTPPSYQLDIADAAAFRDVLDRLERDHGPLDVLINNAGIMPISHFDQESDAAAARIVSVNLLGTIYGTREAFRRMRSRGSGHIINVASMAGRIGTPGLGTYSATKFGIFGYTEAVRGEATGSGVEFSVVLPGVIATRLSAGMTAKGMAKAVSPESVAHAILRTISRPRFEVYAPSFLRGMVATWALAPRSVLDLLVRRLGGDRGVLDAVGSPARADYEREIAALAGDHGADPTRG